MLSDMDKIDLEKITLAYNRAKKRLCLLDLEGTLIPKPSDINSLLKPPTDLLIRLTGDPINDVIVFSERTVPEIKDLFVELPITLVAENGGFYRSSEGEWKSVSDKPLPWRDQVIKALKTLASLYSGSTIKERQFSFVWHYGTQGENILESERKQFQVALRTLAVQHGLVMHEQPNIVELVDPSVGKDKFASYWAGSHWSYDFILAIGDDSTDEELFTLLGHEGATIKVGSHMGSSARFNLQNQDEVIPLLNGLTEPKHVKSESL